MLKSSTQLLSKSTGLSLELHSEIVSKTSLLFLKNMSIDLDTYNRFENIIRYSSLLHDIGKSTIGFQKFLRGKVKKPGLKFRHNEIGWAFLSRYLSNDFGGREIILNIVYWHHGISNQLCKYTDNDILDTLDDVSIDNMLQYLIGCVGIENTISNDMYMVDSELSPLFYPKCPGLVQLQFCRSIVISSDRISSGFMSLDDVDASTFDNYSNLSKDVTISNTIYDGSSRFEDQVGIINSSDKTTIIKAPGGFGKTLMGVMWGFKYSKKVIWVAPRNSIVESLYSSILNEFSNLGINVSYQVILSGEVKYTNDETLCMYGADVIITNIDNFLSPSFKNDIMDSSCLLLNSSIIFDEYHELVTGSPLMALFVNIMRVRNKLTNSNTLLLSATPIRCEYLWDSTSNETNILPNNTSHYPAIHSKKYLIRTVSECPEVKSGTNTLVIKNTIRSSQQEKLDGDYSLLLHSSFTEKKKESNFKLLLGAYNKSSVISNTKDNVIGTHIIQASLDISFNNLYEDVMSPQSTLQRIGRCDRFGNCVGSSVITIVKEKNNISEISIKNILYSRNLSDSWFDYISEYNGCNLTLDELYVIYNSFEDVNKDYIKRYVMKQFNDSSVSLSKIYPIKFDIKGFKSSNILTAGSNKLRSVNSEIFYIVEHENRRDWIGPFTKQVFGGFDIEFSENENILGRMLKTMKKLRDSNDVRFEFNDIIDNKKYQTIDGVRRMSKKSNTPYIVYNKRYNDELGII